MKKKQKKLKVFPKHQSIISRLKKAAMDKKDVWQKSIVILALFALPFTVNARTNNFPNSLNNWEFGDVISEDWANALESAIGVTNSAVTSSLNYLVKHIVPSFISSVNSATDEYCLTYEATGATFEWQTCGSGGSSIDWVFRDNFNTLNLTASTSIPIWAQGVFNASSTVNISGDTTVKATTTTKNLSVTDTGGLSVSLAGTVRSSLSAPGLFFSAPNSGLSNYQFFTMDTGALAVVSINMPSSFGSYLKYTLGNCELTNSGGSLFGSLIIESVTSGCPLNIRTSGTYTNLTIQSTRNLIINGLGTTTPIIFQSNSSDIATFDANGYFGVSTSTPYAKIDVASGTIRAMGFSTSTCNALHMGEIFFNATTGNKRFWGCDGSNWQLIK